MAHLAETTTRGYDSINAARSALSNIIPPEGFVSFGHHRDVTLLMRGIGNEKPKVPRSTTTWDPAKVTNYLQCRGPPRTFIEHAAKLGTLMLLASSQRGHTIHGLRTDRMHLESDKVTFQLDHLCFKQKRRSSAVEPLVFKAFDDEPSLCVVRTLRAYLAFTAKQRGFKKELFVTSRKPHEAVHRSTFSRWVKIVLAEAGVNTEVHGAGSTRAASTSAAFRDGMPLDDILKLGGWSNENTFRAFYLKPLEDTSS